MVAELPCCDRGLRRGGSVWGMGRAGEGCVSCRIAALRAYGGEGFALLRRLWMRGNGLHGLGEGHAEYDDKEVDGVAGALGVWISPEAVFDEDVGVFAEAEGLLKQEPFAAVVGH
jgi:hypothetical protein